MGVGKPTLESMILNGEASIPRVICTRGVAYLGRKMSATEKPSRPCRAGRAGFSGDGGDSHRCQYQLNPTSGSHWTKG